MPKMKFDSRGMPGTKSKNPKKTAICANCGGFASAAGRTSKTGKRFCMADDCRRARDRERARIARTAESAQPNRKAPDACSGCSDPMPPRSWRRGDEFGRWCQKANCRRQRQSLETRIQEKVDLTEERQLLLNIIELLGDAVMADSEEYIHSNRAVCHECGLTTAIRGWVHANQENLPCWGTLGDAPRRPLIGTYLSYAWPFPKEYLPADVLAAAYAEGDGS